MRKSFFLLVLALGLTPIASQAASLSDSLRGSVLLQVESHGEAWYVLPTTGQRIYLKDGNAAYQLMRSHGLGITSANLQKLLAGNATLKKQLRGQIVLNVQSHGEAYYICPKNNVASYIKDSTAAYNIMRSCGLGIKTSDLNSIPVAQQSASPAAPNNPAPTPQPNTPTTPITSSNVPMISSCQIFPANNPWNTDISTYPVRSDSATFISSIGLTSHLHPDFGEDQNYGIPLNVVTNQSMVPITFDAYGDESDPGPYPIPANAKVESGSDAHVLVVETNSCKLYELYDGRKESSTSGWVAQSGAIWDLKTGALRPAGWTSADAAGLPILPGLVRADEVLSGHINHAIRFTASRSQNGYILPATHQAGSNNPALPPMGLRVRLKADYDISQLTGQAHIIAQAMKTYGMILADNGSNWFFQGATDPRWNDDQLNELKSIPGSAFEAVDTGPIVK
jgi:hypothetical protein